MDVIEFRIGPADDAVDLDDELAVGLYVNGRALREHVELVGAPLRSIRQARRLPRDYASVTLGELAGDWSRFLGGRSALLGCTCGAIDCYPLAATVAIDSKTVTWRDFASAGSDWSLDSLGPFIFDRAQYERSLDDARRKARELARWADGSLDG